MNYEIMWEKLKKQLHEKRDYHEHGGMFQSLSESAWCKVATDQILEIMEKLEEEETNNEQ